MTDTLALSAHNHCRCSSEPPEDRVWLDSARRAQGGTRALVDFLDRCAPARIRPGSFHFLRISYIIITNSLYSTPSTAPSFPFRTSRRRLA